MATDELVTFREFQDQESLREYTELLRQHAIPFYVEDSKPRFDVTFANDDSRRFYRIKVAANDLPRAQELSDAIDRELFKELPSDYYLFRFSDDELREVTTKVNEWSAFDVVLAEKLLLERGVAIDPNKLDQSRKEHLVLADQPEDESPFVIVCGYILSLGSILGLFIAWTLLNARKTDSTGQRVYRYSDSTRGHASNMLIIELISFGLSIIFAMIRFI